MAQTDTGKSEALVRKKWGRGVELANPVAYSLLRRNAIDNKKEPTEAEALLDAHLKAVFPKIRFRSQFVIDEYIVDFVALRHKMIIEVDGGYHFETDQIEQDRLREQRLRHLGFNVIRFTNKQVLEHIEDVIRVIKTELYG